MDSQRISPDPQSSADMNVSMYISALISYLTCSAIVVYEGIDPYVIYQFVHPSSRRIEPLLEAALVVGLAVSFSYKWVRPGLGFILGVYASLFLAIQQPGSMLHTCMLGTFLIVFVSGIVIEHRRVHSLNRV